MSKEQRERIELKSEFSVEMQPPIDAKDKHIPMCGWHNNYADFKKGRTKGTIVFAGHGLNVSIDNTYMFTLKSSELVEFCMKARAKHLRSLKPKARLRGIK